MILTLTRRIFTRASTSGDLTGFGARLYTLEDAYPTPYVKTPGKTAIPEGTYRLTVERSPRFSAKAGRDVLLPRLHDVPQFTGVLIHAGNTVEDTEGCILVGRGATLGLEGATLQESLKAMAVLQPPLEAAIKRGEPLSIIVRSAR